jgi:small basic protein
MNGYHDITQGKSVGDLGREAFWFLFHSGLAALCLLGVIVVMTMNHPDPDAMNPKLMATGLAFLVPMIGGWMFARNSQNDIARYVWISGLVIFAVACVWVLDLPTGNGLCENCGAVEKLWRTFFDIEHGSGLMAGDGLVAGTWIPLSMFGYAFGAKFGLRND